MSPPDFNPDQGNEFVSDKSDAFERLSADESEVSRKLAEYSHADAASDRLRTLCNRIAIAEGKLGEILQRKNERSTELHALATELECRRAEFERLEAELANRHRMLAKIEADLCTRAADLKQLQEAVTRASEQLAMVQRQLTESEAPSVFHHAKQTEENKQEEVHADHDKPVERPDTHDWLVSLRTAITATEAGDRLTEPCEFEQRLTALLIRSPDVESPRKGEGLSNAGIDEFFECGSPSPDHWERPKNRRRGSALRSIVTHMMAGGVGVVVYFGLASQMMETEATGEAQNFPLPATTASSQSNQADPVIKRSAAKVAAASPVVSNAKDAAPPPRSESKPVQTAPPSKPVQVAPTKPVAFVPLVLRIRRALPLVAWTADEDPPTASASVPKESKNIAVKEPTKAATETSASLSKPARRPAVKPKTMVKKAVETEMALLDGGVWVVGDELDGLKDAVPHPVKLSPFWIARREVTLELWDRVVNWAHEHGYVDLPPGAAKALDHPVYAVSWLEAVMWCNARSEMEGLTPCYYEDAQQKKVFRTGILNLSNRCVNWEAKGYRLPTEAEWEVAARGRLKGKRFPWGDEITHENANYSSRAAGPFDKSKDRGPPPAFLGSLPHTAPTGSFRPNRFGLYDMSGNVSEWCWDVYDRSYGIPKLASGGAKPPTVSDPRGPVSGISRVVRGGSWRHDAGDARCASRFDLPAMTPFPHVGFRVVRRR